MFDFPNTPILGQQFTPAGGPTYTWSGVGWTLAGSPLAGVLNQQVFTSSGTYTPTPGMQTAIIECVGGGGSGGSVIGVATVNIQAPGGGSGGYSRKFVTAAQVGASQVVTIGAGGIAPAATASPSGTGGGNTSVGSLCVANGAAAISSVYQGGSGGAPGIGDIAAGGAAGSTGTNNSTSFVVGDGVGGSSIFGGGARAPGFPVSGNAASGLNASAYGSGGSGAVCFATSANGLGGNGSAGIVIITEYAAVSTSTATGLVNQTGGFVNKFRNGMMDVAQRGASANISATGYTLDGWLVAPVGATTQWSQQYNVNMSANALRVLCTSGLTALTVQHRIESSIAAQLLNSNKTPQPITIQFTIYNGTTSPITPQISTGFTTARDNYSGTTADLAATNLQTVAAGSMGTVAYTYTPNAGIALGFFINLLFGGALNNSNTALYVDISYADIRATPGIPTGLNNNPPPVEMRPIQQELAFCQRYYYDPANGGSGAVFGNGGYLASNSTQQLGTFPVQMRVAPAVTFRNLAFAGGATGLVSPSGSVAMFQGVVNVSGAGGYFLNFNLTASAEL